MNVCIYVCECTYVCVCMYVSMSVCHFASCECLFVHLPLCNPHFPPFVLELLFFPDASDLPYNIGYNYSPPSLFSNVIVLLRYYFIDGVTIQAKAKPCNILMHWLCFLWYANISSYGEERGRPSGCPNFFPAPPLQFSLEF